MSEEPTEVGAEVVMRNLELGEVHCDADRLLGFLGRAEVEPLNRVAESWLNVSLTGSGDFSGTAYVEGPSGPTVRDARLVFSTDPEIPTLLRNPARPQLSTISLTRNRVASDLVAAEDPAALRLVVNPTLDLVDPDPEALLVVDNLNDDGTRARAKPGRGLDPLRARCHDGYDALDVQVLRILNRLVRPRSEAADEFRVAVYRDREPATYRIDAYAVTVDGTNLGRLSARLTVTTSPQGLLESGGLVALPGCMAVGERDCTDIPFDTSLSFDYPAFRGDPVRPSPYVVSGSIGAVQPAVVTGVDWGDLLAGTDWARPAS